MEEAKATTVSGYSFDNDEIVKRIFGEQTLKNSEEIVSFLSMFKEAKNFSVTPTEMAKRIYGEKNVRDCMECNAFKCKLKGDTKMETFYLEKAKAVSGAPVAGSAPVAPQTSDKGSEAPKASPAQAQPAPGQGKPAPSGAPL